MTEDEIVTLGHYCEDLLNHEFFNTVSQQFAQRCFADFMSTAPAEKEARESSYAKYNGYGDFLAHLASFVAAKNEIEKRNMELSQVMDAPIDGID